MPGTQTPQLMVPPQPSGIVPQLKPAGHAVIGVHPQTLGVPPPAHVWGDAQDGPQSSAGQPTTVGWYVPQLSPGGHDVGQGPGVHNVPLALQAEPTGQVPQWTTPPQPSGALPQTWPAGQVVSPVHSQKFGMPAPPQVRGAGHVPQFTVPPQPSGMVPQLSGAGQAVSLVHSQTLGVPPPPQVSPAGQLGPQLIVGQPGTVKVPQLSPAGHTGGHPAEHAVPLALHIVMAGQLPQLMTPPQPSGATPQICPAEHAVALVHPHTLPAPQVWPAPQLPHAIVPPQPSGIVPQLSGAGHPVFGTHASGVASGAPASARQSRLISAPTTKVRAFSFQSSSPHSRPT
jgi:hypothetical protein